MARGALASTLASSLAVGGGFLIVAVGGGLVIAGCGTSSSTPTSASSSPTAGSSPASTPARLNVAPVRGKPTTVFTFAFTAPRASGPRGHTRLGYELAVLGPAGTGCLAAHTAAAPVVSAGQQVTLTLDPVKLGSVWCQGDYAARVSEVQTPVCVPGQLCPQYIRVVASIARGAFSVVAP